MAFRRSGVALAEPEVLEGAADLRLVGLLLASAMIPFSVLGLMPGIASAATSLVIVHLAGGTPTIRVGSGGIMLPNHALLAFASHFAPDYLETALAQNCSR